MNPDDKLKEAADEHANSVMAYPHEDHNSHQRKIIIYDFLAGAAYIRETEVKALLEFIRDVEPSMLPEGLRLIRQELLK